MSQVQIASRSYCAESGTWTAYASISLPDGTRCGSHCVEVPEDATDDDLAAAIVAQYEKKA